MREFHQYGKNHPGIQLKDLIRPRKVVKPESMQKKISVRRPRALHQKKTSTPEIGYYNTGSQFSQVEAIMFNYYAVNGTSHAHLDLSLIHICRCRRSTLCRSRWSPYH
eukprot:TRINITY_DN16207_c0_g1_i1.p1 TRINITY_DN16207_c0_g1~~TRINITY_DN16207_c0_g1_i1.p1  ORF type:complete len:108 (-),score=20.68 TRINITY_DN16207_c0_g1_i1:17-340(-)